MLRFTLLLVSIIFAAPAFWVQKSIGTNPVAPFTLAKLDTLNADSSRVSGLSDSAKALVRYARTTALHDTANALRAASTLQAAYNASTSPQITTSVTKGALTLRRGSASDPDAVLSVQDGSGAQTAYIAGNGAVAGAQVNVSSATANTLARFDAAKYLTSYALVAGDIPALPAYVRRIGDTITGPIVGTTATATPLISITTTFGNLTNAAIRGTATAANGSALHGVATGANGTGVWGSSTGSTGDGGLFYGANGSNALRAYAFGSGDAGRFEGNVKILGTTTLASSLTGLLKASAGLVSVADTSDFPTRPYLPLAAGAGSPLTGVLYGTGLNFTTTADAPISISHNLAGGFTHPFQAFNSGMVAGNQYNFDFGQSASTNNAANFGFKYIGAGSSSNYVTLGMYGANDLLTITAAGVPKFSGLTASKFVKTDASKGLISTDVAYSDLTGTVPTWNQSTTGNAATATKWSTARNLTIGSSTQALDGTTALTFSLAAIGAQAAGTYLTPSNVSGAANQVAQFTGTNTVGSDNGFTTVKTSGISRYAKIGNGTQAGGAGFEASAPSNQAKSLGFLSNNLYNWELLSVATSHNLELLAYNLGTLIDKPLVVNNASGGAIELGGSTLRPVAISGGLTLRQHATLSTYGAIYGSGVTPGHANYGLLLSKNGDYGNLNGAVNVALTVGNAERVTATAAGSTLAGTTTLSGLTGATTRIATISAAGQIGATSTFPLVGVTDGSSACAGCVGEILSAYASGTTFSGTTSGVSIASLALPAGAWLVWSSSQITNGQSPSSLIIYLSYSSTGTSFIDANASFALGSPVAFSGISCATTPIVINRSTTANVYLIGSELTTGTAAINNGATIFAQRIR